jgi:predicted peptidase
MKKYIIVFLALIFLFCGCTDQPAETLTPTEPPIFTQPPTEPPTEAPTDPPTEPIHYLGVDPGSFLETYKDEHTSNYFDYYLHIPEHATENMPLFVFLHGDGEVAKPWSLENYGPIQSAREIYGEEFPFIAIFPCTRMQSWVSGNIPETLKGLIDYTADRFKCDTERIILTGHSRGSIGVWNMVSLYGNFFSCAVPISCGPDTNMNYENCANVPIRAVVGMVGELENNYGAAMKRTVDKLTELGGTAEIIVMESLAHEQTSTATYTEEMFEWMLSQ